MSLISTLWKSFLPPDAYRDAALNWHLPKALCYFFILCIICTLSASVASFKFVDMFFDNYIDSSLPELSKIEIEAGKISTPENKDIFLKDKAGNVFALITPNIADAEQTKGLMFVVDKNRIAFFIGDNEQYIPLESAVPEGTKATLASLFPPKDIIKFGILPAMCLIASCITILTYSLIIGLAGRTLTIIALPDFTYLKCVKMALVAITPPSLIDAFVVIFVGKAIPGVVFALIAVVLIWMSVKSISKSTKEVG